MGSTRIIVVQLKELIKTAVFVVLGVILIGVLIYLFIPKDKENTSMALYVPGTYTSTIQLNKDFAEVVVTVDNNTITDIGLQNLGETQEVFYPLVRPTLDTISQEIIEKQSLAINISAESPVTSEILLQAVSDALAQAKAKLYQ